MMIEILKYIANDIIEKSNGKIDNRDKVFQYLERNFDSYIEFKSITVKSNKRI